MLVYRSLLLRGLFLESTRLFGSLSRKLRLIHGLPMLGCWNMEPSALDSDVLLALAGTPHPASPFAWWAPEVLQQSSTLRVRHFWHPTSCGAKQVGFEKKTGLTTDKF